MLSVVLLSESLLSSCIVVIVIVVIVAVIVFAAVVTVTVGLLRKGTHVATCDREYGVNYMCMQVCSLKLN